MTEFSVLLPVYAGDRADWLRRAFTSATTEQQQPPSQVVLVRDGPVPAPLQDLIDALIAESAVPVTYVPLEQNRRLAGALQEGLQYCEHDIIARVDADDICLPHRFAVQIPQMDDLDLLGATVVEFHTEHSGQDRLGAHRSRPRTAAAIRRYAAFHNPFNHPAVVYRKTAVQAVGGYEDMPLMEDYWLFVRMIIAGANVANEPQALVHYRVGEGLFDRRGGWTAMRSDWQFQRRAHQLGLTTRVQFIRNLVSRVAYRLVPSRIRAWGYRRFVADRGQKEN